jgi:hypothetical protein
MYTNMRKQTFERSWLDSEYFMDDQEGERGVREERAIELHVW